MAFEFIQIPANGQGSAKEELNKLLRNGRIASVKKEFVSNGEDSFWAFCIEFLDGTLGVMDKGRGDSSGPKIDYKEVLNEADFAVFARLRDLRKVVCEKEAIPAYSIFTNEQLAAMVTGKVDSLTAMGTIPGVGAARLDKYGAAFLASLTGKEAAKKAARRHKWQLKLDIRKYFESIPQERLIPRVGPDGPTPGFGTESLRDFAPSRESYSSKADEKNASREAAKERSEEQKSGDLFAESRWDWLPARRPRADDRPLMPVFCHPVCRLAVFCFSLN
jgi:HRDC domain